VSEGVVGPFAGAWRFLSNFYPASVEFENVVYPTVEHAFQAAKSADLDMRRRILEAPTPGEAKSLGRGIDPRPDWDLVREEVMLQLLRQKFSDQTLQSHLLDTAEQRIVEINTWGDTYWGVCRGVGENRLGLLLERVRHEAAQKMSRHET
jgi:ribA/ribD-fused uncharacterized protein